MMKHSGSKIIYITVLIITTIITITGATFAYWTASAQSSSNSVKTHSTIYSISMDISSLYHGYSLIPMDDNKALKGLQNKCKDKYDRGACLAYKIRVYDYNEDLKFVSGIMDINTNGMNNISYMMYRISDEYDEENCVTINEKHYCKAKEPAHMGTGLGLSLGDKYDVSGMPETEFILLIWLTNLQTSQNDTDIGDFNAIITMQAGNGGQITGSISSVITPDTNNPDDGTGDGTTPSPDEPTKDDETIEGGSETGEGTEIIE